MAKTILGVDIGHDQLKLALVRGRQVVKAVSAPMPENLMRQGRVTSLDTMSDLIKTTMKSGGLRAGHAAIVLPNDVVFVKNVEMPVMNTEQLEYNLPFEFNDYITGELREYVFDYAMVSDVAASGEAAEGENEGSTPTMELLAVGTLKSLVEDARSMMRKAGMKLVRTAPAISAYIGLIRAQQEALSQVAEEYCVLDLGYEAIRMYMFRGDRHVATRLLETGMATLDNVLADVYGVDVHLAHTYLMSNFEDCQHREECMNAYSNISVELMRALNFYRFSNPDSALEHMWLCGGGAVIEPLAETISDMLNIQLHPAAELVPGGAGVSECNTYAQAIGIALEEPKAARKTGKPPKAKKSKE